jgi:hypothetical protein
MEVGVDVNVEKTNYVLLTRHRKAGQILDINKANRSFENATD